jgi:iron complex transport system substrate-binding protein
MTVLLTVAPVAGVAAPVSPATGGGGSGSPGDDGTQCTFPVEVEDATGETVRIEDDPDRVITLAPSAAQTMWELEAQDQVVGVSQFALYLEGADEKANVSAPGVGNYDVETIVAEEPDLVLAPNVVGNETVQQLREAGLTVVKFFAATSVGDVERKTTLIGRFTGNCEAAEETNRWMNENVDAARSATEDAERKRVLYLTGTFTTGSDTFIHDMIVTSGGRNIVAEAGVEGFKPVNEEIVADRDPQWIVVTTPGSDALDREPYNSTTAGQEGNLLVVNVNYLNQPAPRSVVFAVRNVTEAFHPDLYGPEDYVDRSAVEVTPTPTTTTTTTETTTTAETTTTTAATTETTTTTTTEEPTPGFGVLVAVLAVLGALLLYRRR